MRGGPRGFRCRASRTEGAGHWPGPLVEQDRAGACDCERRSVTRYPVREQEGIVEAEVQGQGQLNTAFGIGDGAHMLLPDGSVDCVLLGLMIGLVPDPEALLREVVRVLKPAGSVIIADPFDAFYDYDYPWDHRLTPTAVIKALKRVVPEATVEMTGPVSYEEHWAHSRTVTYDTILITARCKA